MRCSNLASVTIPEGIETIGFDAFTYSGLKTLTLPSTIRDMMQSFVSCEQLETLTLTDGITELDGSKMSLKTKSGMVKDRSMAAQIPEGMSFPTPANTSTIMLMSQI